MSVGRRTYNARRVRHAFVGSIQRYSTPDKPAQASKSPDCYTRLIPMHFYQKKLRNRENGHCLFTVPNLQEMLLNRGRLDLSAFGHQTDQTKPNEKQSQTNPCSEQAGSPTTKEQIDFFLVFSSLSRYRTKLKFLNAHLTNETDGVSVNCPARCREL